MAVLTDDAADVVPDGDLVGDDGAPVEGAAQIERQPEEEGVVDELQAGVRQRVLQRNKRRVHSPITRVRPASSENVPCLSECMKINNCSSRLVGKKTYDLFFFYHVVLDFKFQLSCLDRDSFLCKK